jgi:fucose permease
MATYLLILVYFAFISLGLPDSLLGVTWPVMQPGFQVPFSFAGIASMVLSGGTIVSSLLSGRVLQRFGVGRVTFVSVMMTAAALLGFSLAPSFAWIIILSVPLGLGAGAVDSGLNEYVAEHYKAIHMNWLHCFWGVGAVSGPLIMSQLIARDQSWRNGYLAVSLVQFALVAVLFFSLPVWEKAAPRAASARAQADPAKTKAEKPAARGLFFPLQIRGVKIALLAFLSYGCIESTLGLWSSSYLVHARGLDAATAAAWVSSFYASITVGRLVSGFITLRVSNKMLIRTGELVILAGVLLLFLPLPAIFALLALILIGLGCAPIFPSMLHETPVRFGKENAQLVMGFQMAVAYFGSTLFPPLFGFIATNTSLALLPVFILAYIATLLASSERVNAMLAHKLKPAQETSLGD